MTLPGRPAVGTTVHYVSYGTPGGEFKRECRAAIVTYVDPDPPAGGEMDCDLAVLNPTGMFFDRAIPYDDPTAEQPGMPDCPNSFAHGSIFRYCACGWREASPRGGTWHHYHT